MNHIELLAPAGDWEAFQAAVQNGADAVYLGGKLFNARQYAGNFDEENLEKALDYAHIRNTRVYLTMNTLIADREMEEAVAFAGDAWRMGIDGIIVQDLGLASMLRKYYPGIILHGSTQMTIHNAAGAAELEKLGFQRVVLARELSLQEIQAITQSTSLEVEVFVHGALCVSYSGQCLMSSMIGGRSGNRGRCAQPCRLQYQLVEAKGEGKTCARGYLLSPKDLCTVDMVSELVHAGITSLKIEGRMKSPEYVATVVSTYRKYLDQVSEGRVPQVETEDRKTLQQIFNRGGFSTGYLRGKTGSSMMSYEKPKNWGVPLGEVVSYDAAREVVTLRLQEELAPGDGLEVWNGREESPGTVVSEIRVKGARVELAHPGDIAMVGFIKGIIPKGSKVFKTTNKRLNLAARESFTRGEQRKISLEGKMKIRAGAPVELEIISPWGHRFVMISDGLAQQARIKPTTAEKVEEQLQKTGGTPFAFTHLDIDISPDTMVPVSEINNLRRKALERLEEERRLDSRRSIHIAAAEVSMTERTVRAVKAGKPRIALKLAIGHSQVDYSLLEVDRLYLPFAMLLAKDAADRIQACREQGIEVFIWIPSITRGHYDRLFQKHLPGLLELPIEGILAGNLWGAGMVQAKRAWRVTADHTLHPFNSASLEQLQEMGFAGATLSQELNLNQIKSMYFPTDMEVEAVIYGRTTVMTSEYCPVGSLVGGFTGNKSCSSPCNEGSYRLRDRKDMEFPVLCDRIDCRSTILNSSVLYLGEDLAAVANTAVDWLRLDMTDEDYREIPNIVELHKHILQNGSANTPKFGQTIKTLRVKGTTKGHYFRGIE